jgi:hypothetical protein
MRMEAETQHSPGSRDAHRKTANDGMETDGQAVLPDGNARLVLRASNVRHAATPRSLARTD